MSSIARKRPGRPRRGATTQSPDKGPDASHTARHNNYAQTPLDNNTPWLGLTSPDQTSGLPTRCCPTLEARSQDPSSAAPGLQRHASAAHSTGAFCRRNRLVSGPCLPGCALGTLSDARRESSPRVRGRRSQR